MFRKLFNTIQIFVLVFSLLNLNAIAIAQETQSNSEKKEHLEGVKEADFLNSITMIAIGFIATRLFTYKMSTDVMIAAAGGAAFIVGEIASTGKFKSVQKDLEIEQKNIDPDQKQFESLNSLKKSYEDAKDAAETKKKFQTAAAAAFMVAAGVAFFMKGLEITSEAATLAADSAAGAAASAAAVAATASCPETGVGCALITPCTTCASLMFAKVPIKGLTFETRDNVLMPSMGMMAKMTPMRLKFMSESVGCSATCPVTMPALAAEEESQAVEIVDEVTGIITVAHDDSLFFKKIKPFRFYTTNSIPSINHNYFDKLLGFVFPKAEASTTGLLMGGAGVGAGLLIGMIGSMGPTVDTFLFAPRNRAILWGVLSGLAMMSAKSSDNVIQKLDGNIQKVDKMMAALNTKTTYATGPQAKFSPNLKVKEDGGPSAINAINGETDSMNLDGTSSCIASNGEKNCRSLTSQLEANQGFSKLPAPMQILSKDMTKMADGMSGTNKISNSTMGLVNSNGGKLNAISKMLDQHKSSLSALLSKNGKKPLNYEKEQNEIQKSINNAIQTHLKKNNMSAGNFLASIGSGMPAPLQETNTNSEPPAEMKSNSAGAFVAPTTTPTNNNGNIFGTNNEQAPEEMKDETMLSSAEKLESLELNDNDITKDKEVSLFELISNRYKKSGYPRLFKKIE
jgi:hypothetical protein